MAWSGYTWPARPDERGDLKTASVVADSLVVGGHPLAGDLIADGWEVVVLSNAGPDLGSPHAKFALIDGTGNDPDQIRRAIGAVVDRLKAGRKVAVLCRSGANRSPAVAACALFLAGRAKSPFDALEAFRRVRREASRGKTFDECVSACREMPGGEWLGELRARNYHVEYYEEHRAAGLDYLGHGDWQEQYSRWLVGAMGWIGANVLDAGCACGSIAEGLRKAGCRPHGVDLNNHAIGLGRRKWPHLPLYVCDCVNLHLFGDHSFGGIHCAQVAEHWRPELVPFILAELARVLRPGGTLFLCLDTEELFARQGRTGDGGDPTHLCVRPLAWWVEQLAAAGFERAEDLASALRSHPGSFFTRYDWDWLALRKVAPAMTPAAGPVPPA